MSESIRKNRRIVVRVKEKDYEVLCSNYGEGFASNGEWMVMVSLELIVLNSQLLGVGPSAQLGQGTSGEDILPTASKELLYSLGLINEPTTPGTPSRRAGGVAGATRTTPAGVPTISPDLSVK